MLAFPPQLPDPSWRFTTRLPRDHYIRVHSNDYSVNPRFVGRRINIQVTLDEVIATCDRVEVARHRRFFGAHETFLAVDHARALRAMRVEAASVDAAGSDEVEERDLTVYDRISGVAS